MQQGKEHVPTAETRALVQTWSGLGQPQEAIGRRLNISVKTLHKHYRTELDVGIDLANNEVANSILLAATGREVIDDKGTIKRIPVNATLAIYWSKVRMQWREPPREIDGASDGNTTIIVRGGLATVQEPAVKTNGHDTAEHAND